MNRKLVGIAGILVIGTLCCAGNAFAIGSDDVRSRHIAEADGTSGQDTNSGTGVKTGHIQDGAVTDAKINDVSMAKVTGLQTAMDSKADAAHLHYTGNMTVVATSGGEYTNPADAVTDIENWCGTPSVDNPCLIQVMPGVYNIPYGSNINLPAYVNLAGAGEESTKLTGITYTPSAVGGLVNVVHSEIQDITIESTNKLGYASAAINISGDSLVAKNVTAIGKGGNSSVYGIVSSGTQDVEIDLNDVNIQVSADGAHNTMGIYVYGPWNEKNVKMRDVSVSVNGSASSTTFPPTGIYLFNQTGHTDLSDIDVNCDITDGAAYGMYLISNGRVANANVVTTVGSGFSGIGFGLPGYSADYDVSLVDSSIIVNGNGNALSQSGNGSWVQRLLVSNTKVVGATTGRTTGLFCRNVFDENLNDVTCLVH